MAKGNALVPYNGALASLPSSGLTTSELIITTDSHEVFIATGAATTVPLVPPILELTELATAPAAGDWLIVHDIDEAGAVKIKKVTAANAGATDAKVGVDSGATAGYLGVAYNDGVLRTDQSISVTDGGDFITLAIAFGSDAEGDICQRGASIYERLAIGTANQILAVNAGATALEYIGVFDGGTF